MDVPITHVDPPMEGLPPTTAPQPGPNPQYAPGPRSAYNAPHGQAQPASMDGYNGDKRIIQDLKRQFADLGDSIRDEINSFCGQFK